MDKITLNKYADLLINFGLRIKEKEKLIINLDENGLELAREMTRVAYEAGAVDVKLNIIDVKQLRARYLYGSSEALVSYQDYEVEYRLAQMKDGYNTVRLCTYNAPDNNLDIDKVTRYDKVVSEAFKEVRGYAMRSDIKWTVAPVVSDDWAKLLYPEESLKKGRALVEKELEKILRLNSDSPINEWKLHNAKLGATRDKLNDLNLVKLHFIDKETDLIVHLADKPVWCGGEDVSSYGASFMANIPTEEIFTMPHKYKVDGYVKIQKPFLLYGKEVKELELTFVAGKVVDFKTDASRELIQRLLDTDSGSSRLGEIALVERTSPINEFSHVFYNTLIDENACSHMALGDSYADTSVSVLDKDEAGSNSSSVHVDVMLGTDTMKVVGTNVNGHQIIIMENGLFTI